MKVDSTWVFDMSRDYVQDNRLQLGEVISKRILGWIRSRDIPRLATCSELVSSLHSMDDPCFRLLLQIEAFFKKNAAFSNPIQSDSATVEAFNKAETKCRITNRRLEFYYFHPERLSSERREQFSKMIDYVQYVLGDYSKFISSLPRNIKFTAGATSKRSRRKSAPYQKVSLKPWCTPTSEVYLKTLAKFFGYGENLRARLTSQNRLEIVPKNWKTGRMIACEPEGSLILQLAFDSYAKRRLLHKVGIDLRDQSRNQQMAKEGSIYGSYATIDLSSASDTVAFNLVSWLFPYPWFKYLNDCRSPQGLLEGRVVDYAKFSSMGNGATFTIETLIFASACKAVGSKYFSVYGDDIIIETELYEKLTDLLRFLGFTPNLQKSHSRGPFRESCGGNYVRGVDVTPFYIRDMDQRHANLCHLVNGLAAVSLPGGKVWDRLRDLVSSLNLPLIPFCEQSTSGVWVDPSTAYLKKVLRSRHGMLYYKGYIPRSKARRADDIRSLFLWHLDATRRDVNPAYDLDSLNLVRGSYPNRTREKTERSIIRSRTPLPSHKYVRKWVHWFHPVAVAPLHLYWWSSFITRES